VHGHTATCQGCHNNEYAPDRFTAFFGTEHWSMFSRGIDGLLGEDYGESCLVCHTVGYSAAASNNGFDDVAAIESWEVPEVLTEGNWETMTRASSGLAQLANIQCESCHGPQDSAAHMTGVRGRLAAGMCARCHDSGSHTVKAYEWSRSTHSNLSVAQAYGTVDGMGAHAGYCGRCHSGQGFLEYAANLAAGNPSPLAEDEEYLRGIGMDRDHVEPVTCATCHDPHSSVNPHQVRLYDEIELLPAGFRVDGAGSGAICMACHNTGNGAHDDGHLPTDYTIPNVPAQADVLLGRNGYFMGRVASIPPPHAALENTCATCHMAEPDHHDFPTVGGHTWRVRDDLCERCHGEGVNLRGLQATVEQNLETLEDEVIAQLIGDLTEITRAGRTYSVRAWDLATGCYSSESADVSNVTLSMAPMTATLEHIDDEFGFAVTFDAEIPITWRSAGCSGSTSTRTVFFQLGSLVSSGSQVVGLDDVLVGAIWNVEVLHGDGSYGVHNATWTFRLLAASLEALADRE